MTARWDETVDALDAADLVGRAAEGDGWAWERLVEKYERLIWAVTRDFKLVESDAADVTQVTWLRLLEHINRLDQPGRVGSWLATTARHECLRSLAARKKTVLASEDDTFEQAAAHGPEIDEQLLAAERAQDVRDALACLPPRWQQLLQLLMADPPIPYTEISSQLGLPIGSIGPTRARCLAKIRTLLQPTEPRPPIPEPSTANLTSGTASRSGQLRHGASIPQQLPQPPAAEIPRHLPARGSRRRPGKAAAVAIRPVALGQPLGHMTLPGRSSV